MHTIAAQRIVAFCAVRRVLERNREVARPLVVVEDDFLIQVAEVGHYAKTSFTLRMPATSASMSSYGVVERQRGSGGGGELKAVHHRLRAMMTGADRDALPVQDGADVVRMHAIDYEGKYARPFAAPFRSISTPGNARHARFA